MVGAKMSGPLRIRAKQRKVGWFDALHIGSEATLRGLHGTFRQPVPDGSLVAEGCGEGELARL